MNRGDQREPGIFEPRNHLPKVINCAGLNRNHLGKTEGTKGCDGPLGHRIDTVRPRGLVWPSTFKSSLAERQLAHFAIEGDDPFISRIQGLRENPF